MAWSDRKERADKFSEELLESENDRLIANVANKVSTLKHVALDLRTEAKDQVKLIDDSGGLFEAAGSLLSGSFKRVQGMRRMRLQNCKYMCYITVVAAFMLLVLYFLVGRAMS